MDWDLLKIVLTLAQAAKEWPLTTLIVVCITALLAIPVVMVTKRWLDMTWLNRDSYIAMLAENKGRLQKEVEEWQKTAENALAGERRLIEQATHLQERLANIQMELPRARLDAENATQALSELTRQNAQLAKELKEATERLKKKTKEAVALATLCDDLQNDIDAGHYEAQREIAEGENALFDANVRIEELEQELEGPEDISSDDEGPSMSGDDADYYRP